VNVLALSCLAYVVMRPGMKTLPGHITCCVLFMPLNRGALLNLLAFSNPASYFAGAIPTFRSRGVAGSSPSSSAVANAISFSVMELLLLKKST